MKHCGFIQLVFLSFPILWILFLPSCCCCVVPHWYHVPNPKTQALLHMFKYLLWLFADRLLARLALPSRCCCCCCCCCCCWYPLHLVYICGLLLCVFDRHVLDPLLWLYALWRWRKHANERRRQQERGGRMGRRRRCSGLMQQQWMNWPEVKWIVMSMQTKRWWVTNMIINKSIDINSPCSFCTMSSRVLLWCVCNN